MSASSTSASTRLSFQKKAHIRYLERCLTMLPTLYQTEECSRMSLAYFVLSSLDLLNAIDTSLTSAQKQEYIDWIYAQQDVSSGGFRGGALLSDENNEAAHIVMTYTALLNLAILRDDFTRLDKPALLRFVKRCQHPDGSFVAFPGSQEKDVRFVYCAFVILHLLDAFHEVDVEGAKAYLLCCRSYDFAFGQSPGLEAQGGTTYCVLAALSLINGVQDLPHKHRTLDWLVHRLVPLNPEDLDGDDYHNTEEDITLFNEIESGALKIFGYQGRPEKDPDACYSFWIGASIKLLLPDSTIANKGTMDQDFLLLCQNQRGGGLAKFPDEYPDVYHTYLALAALALSGNIEELSKLEPAINVSVTTSKYLEDRMKGHTQV